jgi:methionyl-tRNA formyltransferase
MHERRRSVLFLGKRGDGHVERALELCRRHFDPVTAYLGQWGDPFPGGDWEGDYIISYLSRWVVPAQVLERAAEAALNFHPAPPQYPGVGCNNFALYDGVTQYGVTCHHMAPAVDSGRIVAVRRFPVLASDDVATLLARAYDEQLALFCEVVGGIAQGEPLPESGERWTRRPYTRRELDALMRITPDMSREEIARRVRATRFGRFKPRIELEGFVFELKSEP